MIKSFQSYMVYWYSSVLSITLVVFSILLYLLVSRVLDDSVDSALLTLANVEIIAAFELENPGEEVEAEPHIHVSPLDSGQFETHGIRDRYVNILTKAGKSITSHSPQNGTTEIPGVSAMPIDQNIVKSIEKSERLYQTLFFKGEFLRVLYLPVVYKGEMAYIVQLGSEFTHIITIKQKIAVTLFLLNLALITVSVITGYFLAQKAAYPIKAISATALKVNEKNLDERIEFTSSFLEIKQLVDILNAMLGRIETAFNDKKRFLSNASHEIKSPITSVKCMLEVLLRKERPTEEYVSGLKCGLDETNRLSNLVQELLNLSMADEKKAFLSEEKFLLDELIGGVLEWKKTELTEKNLKVRCSIESHIAVNGDRGMLRQMFFNLIENAIHYTPDSGEISIDACERDERLFCEIKDTGIGINSKDLSKVFDRFFRVDKSRSRESGGTGLGLSIVKEIVYLHNGEVLVESQEGVGTTFTVIIPKTQPSLESPISKA